MQHLCKQDAALNAVIQKHGHPELFERTEGFGTLIHIMLEQQVSLASALAAYTRLQKELTPLTPENFLSLNDETLKRIGFSRQKTRYARDLATRIQTKQLELRALAALPDDVVRAELMKVTGIGVWTANVYLMMVLKRPDVWPVGDLALAVAVQEIKGLASRPSHEALSVIAQAWRPWRTVAANILWHHYLSTPRRKKQE